MTLSAIQTTHLCAARSCVQVKQFQKLSFITYYTGFQTGNKEKESEIERCGGNRCVTECPKDWENHGDHCYLWSDKDTSGMKTWDKAEAFCIQKGGHLASATTAAIEAYIYKGKKKRKLQHLWLGGSDKEKEGVWKWSDGSPWKFTKWNRGQPTSVSEENCLQYYGGRTNAIRWSDRAIRWSDRPCSDEGNFVCSQLMCSG